MRQKIKIKYPIIVEGKYDKNTLSQLFDTVIIPTFGFGIFNSKEKQALLRKIGADGIIVLTDSDSGGKQIRSFLSGILPKGALYHLYIPQIEGKEKRKAHASKQGLLGVEGMEAELLLDLFSPFVLDEKGDTGVEKDPITRLDLYNDGLSGGEGAAARRAALCKKFELPADMNSKALLEALNIITNRKEYKAALEEVDMLG